MVSKQESWMKCTETESTAAIVFVKTRKRLAAGLTQGDFKFLPMKTGDVWLSCPPGGASASRQHFVPGEYTSQGRERFLPPARAGWFKFSRLAGKGQHTRLH